MASKVEATAVGDQGQAARQGHVTRVASRRRGAQLALAPGSAVRVHLLPGQGRAHRAPSRENAHHHPVVQPFS